MASSILKLPAYPSAQTRNSLSPSQLASLNQTISSSLSQVLALPPAKRDTPSTHKFISTYTRDAAHQTLQSLIWEEKSSRSREEKLIRKRTLLLAEKLSLDNGLECQTLVDLAIVYARTNLKQTRAVFEATVKSSPSVISVVESELVPAFTLLLSDPSHSAGLYGLRKTAQCILSFLKSSSPNLITPFTHSKEFILALANAYDRVLTSIADSYGGLSVLHRAESRDLDDWERIWLDCKVSLSDTFHVLITALLDEIATAQGRSLGESSERAFDIIFSLLDLSPASSSASTNLPPTPFLNQTLLADYQQSYDLSRTLATALSHAAEKDVRLDLLESSLRSLEGESTDAQQGKNPGVLKLILRSSGVPPGVDNLGKGRVSHNTMRPDKGKGKAPAFAEHSISQSLAAAGSSTDADLDMQVTQVLDIFPDQSPQYIHTLLSASSYPFAGSAEKVIEALLEGTAPSLDDLETVTSEIKETGVDEFAEYVKGRQNVFDEDPLDLTRLRVGKKSEDAATALRDRTFVEQMKADILRRAEAMSDDEEELEEEDSPDGQPLGKRPIAIAFDEELDPNALNGPKIVGDGEDSGDEDDDDEEDEAGEGEVGSSQHRPSPETVLELAYLRDPKLFDRDANTRRSKGRAELVTQTGGWSNEQIEGWKVMLERNPKKDKILQKHEFAGNQPLLADSGAAGPSRGGRGGGGRGGRGGAGRGRGGRGGGAGGEGGASSAKERAWKDKNKASRGNHNRKRGHDKKMARGGGGMPV